jgi:hypothetical protein
MPLFHCIKCQHEWEGTLTQDGCDWCGAPGTILETETSLETMLRKNTYKEIIKKLKASKGLD